MHPYIPYLLSDIANAHRKNIPSEIGHEDSYHPCNPNEGLEEEFREDALDEHFKEIEAWLNRDEAEHTFGYYCGMETIDFPPSEQLTEEEMKLVCEAFSKMMFSWNITIDLPEDLPVDRAYKMIVETLNTKTTIVSQGFIGFDYCTGDPTECELKEYCSCLKLNWDKHID